MGKVVVVLVALLAFAYGVYSGYSRDATFRALVPIWRVLALRSYSNFNEFDQLVRYPKTEVECPRQTPRTMVALVFGQSNAANQLGKRYDGRPNVFNYFEGRCFHAVDPLLGNSGLAGSQWVVTANRIADRHDAVILVPLAVHGSGAADWLARLKPMLRANLAGLRANGYTVTHALWHQGESDAYTREDAYRATVGGVIRLVRSVFPGARFFVSTASYCGATGVREQIRSAQRALVDPAQGVLAGPDTDRYIALEDRTDDCHLAAAGQEKVARDWAEILGQQ